MKKILVVMGTRPEAIKMAPLVKALSKESWVELRVLATAQHRQMLDQVTNFFSIKPDIDLNLMKNNQGLSALTADLLLKVNEVLLKEKPDAVLVQGDTTTVMAVALASFYLDIPVGHIEAGLRTWDMQNPFPEEFNRSVVAKIARWHFAPTEEAAANLIKDGVLPNHIKVTGNTVIDALHYASKKVDESERVDFLKALEGKRFILVTSHRRENLGEPLHQICVALKRIAIQNPSDYILFPVHLNPNVRRVVFEHLQGISNIVLTDPLDYQNFIACMKQSYLILTDSGGVQEEAPALGKPVLVLRDETERPEAVKLGVVKIIGPHSEKIVEATQELLDDSAEYKKMAKGVSPYGDGKAVARIVDVLKNEL